MDCRYINRISYRNSRNTSYKNVSTHIYNVQIDSFLDIVLRSLLVLMSVRIGRKIYCSSCVGVYSFFLSISTSKYFSVPCESFIIFVGSLQTQSGAVFPVPLFIGKYWYYFCSSHLFAKNLRGHRSKPPTRKRKERKTEQEWLLDYFILGVVKVVSSSMDFS